MIPSDNSAYRRWANCRPDALRVDLNSLRAVGGLTNKLQFLIELLMRRFRNSDMSNSRSDRL